MQKIMEDGHRGAILFFCILKSINCPLVKKTELQNAPIATARRVGLIIIHHSEKILDFTARGLRPLSPCHLTCMKSEAVWILQWITRGGVKADTWDGLDIPLGEESEQYHVRVLRSGQTVMEFTTSSPNATISNAQITAHQLDIDAQAISIEVAQISNTYGSGVSAVLEHV